MQLKEPHLLALLHGLGTLKFTSHDAQFRQELENEIYSILCILREGSHASLVVTHAGVPVQALADKHPLNDIGPDANAAQVAAGEVDPVAAHAALKAFVNTARTFVDKCERGEARSVVTYTQLKNALYIYDHGIPQT